MREVIWFLGQHIYARPHNSLIVYDVEEDEEHLSSFFVFASFFSIRVFFSFFFYTSLFWTFFIFFRGLNFVMLACPLACAFACVLA